MHKIKKTDTSYDQNLVIVTFYLDTGASTGWMNQLQNLNIPCTPGHCPYNIEYINLIGIKTKSFWITVSKGYEESIKSKVRKWVDLVNAILCTSF